MIKLKKILFPSDFGESAEDALRYAVMLAGEYDAELTMMHVVSIYTDTDSLAEEHLSDMAKYAEDFTGQRQQDAHDRIDRAIEAQNLNMKKMIVRGISPYQEIVRVAQEEDIDLVVMGTYGKGGVTHFLFGSTAEQVVRLVDCPVLTVRHQAPLLGDFSGIRNILFPTDFSDYSKRALPYALSFAGRYGATLHVLHVFEQRVHPSFYIMDKSTPFDLDDSLRERALKALDEFVSPDLKDRISFRCEAASGKPFVEIINYARRNEIDLIVIATHGLTGLEYMVIGSTTERVVRKSPCPVLSIKDPEHEFVKL
ncbi:MAG: universal stress protein [Gemmatimonadota bacterium]|nr:universal stress protein [Gemmatimonadota bacterium]